MSTGALVLLKTGTTILKESFFKFVEPRSHGERILGMLGNPHHHLTDYSYGGDTASVTVRIDYLTEAGTELPNSVRDYLRSLAAGQDTLVECEHPRGNRIQL